MIQRILLLIFCVVVGLLSYAATIKFQSNTAAFAMCEKQVQFHEGDVVQLNTGQLFQVVKCSCSSQDGGFYTDRPRCLVFNNLGQKVELDSKALRGKE